MFNLFSRKKKFKANCELSKMPIDRESAYMLSTAQIISSRKFWDNIMTEPDTLSYTEAHFKNADKTATNIRNMIFKKYAKEDKAWIVSDSQVHLFDIDLSTSKALANTWWDSSGSLVPEHMVNSVSAMDDKTFDEIKAYAIHDAGRELVKA